MNQPSYFEIQADDMTRALDFYQTIFKWKFIKQGGLPIDYYRIETEGISGGLLPRPSKAPKSESGANASVISMQVENFDETAKIIMSKNGQIALPKFSIPGKCWQGYFVDTEGNAFGIFEADASAK